MDEIAGYADYVNVAKPRCITVEVSEIRLIHPLDVLKLLSDSTLPLVEMKDAPAHRVPVTRMYEGAEGWHECGQLISFDGIVYLQTTLVPAITKEFK